MFLTLRLHTLSADTFNQELFEKSLAEGLAVESEQVLVSTVLEGSVVVECEVQPQAGDTSLSLTDAEAMVDDLQNKRVALDPALGNYTLLTYRLPKEGDDGDDLSTMELLIIMFAAALGLGCFVGGGLAIRRARRMQRVAAAIRERQLARINEPTRDVTLHLRVGEEVEEEELLMFTQGRLEDEEMLKLKYAEELDGKGPVGPLPLPEPVKNDPEARIPGERPKRTRNVGVQGPLSTDMWAGEEVT